MRAVWGCPNLCRSWGFWMGGGQAYRQQVEAGPLPCCRCLYEALQAVASHVDLDLLVEDVQSGVQNVDKLQQVFTKASLNFIQRNRPL